MAKNKEKIFVDYSQHGLKHLTYDVLTKENKMTLDKVVDKCKIVSTDFETITMSFTRTLITKENDLNFSVGYDIVLYLNAKTKDSFKTEAELKEYAEEVKIDLLEKTPAIRCTSLLISQIVAITSGEPIITAPHFIEE
jgi:hypothetical protein